MKVEKYPIVADESGAYFQFASIGPKGKISKAISFQYTGSNIYNLAFGDKNSKTGEIDDMVVTANGDTEKVLATVAEVLGQFLEDNPLAMVYAIGSTPSRTRLYQMGIARFFQESKEKYRIYGRLGDHFEEFSVDKNYDAFLVHLKIDNLQLL